MGASFGPYGALAGLIIGGVVGGVKGDQVRKQRLAAEKADREVNPINVQEQALLNRIGMLEANYRAGTDPASSFARQLQSNALAQTQKNIVSAGFGNVSNLLRAQGQTNLGYAQIGATAAQNADRLLPMQVGIQNAITERIYGRMQQRRADAYARHAQGQQDLNNMFSGGMATMPNTAASFKKTGTGTAPTSSQMTQQINSSLPANRPMSYATPNTPGKGVGVLNPSEFSYERPPVQKPAWWSGDSAPSWYSSNY